VGKSMVSKAKRPIKNFNVQNRAERELDRQKTKPTPAPKHQTTEPMLKKYVEDNPHVKEEVAKKNDDLVANMNRLKLEVTGKNPEIKYSNPDRPLPQHRGMFKDSMLLSEKPEKVPLGKLSLVQAAEMLSKHKKTPEEYSAKVIAAEYKLDLDETYCLLQYFYSLDMDDNQLLDLSAVQKSLIQKMLIYSQPKEGKDSTSKKGKEEKEEKKRAIE